MSSPVSVDDITAISLRFAVKWSISVQELAHIPSPNEKSTLKSNIYRFKGIQNLEFSFILLLHEFYKLRVDTKTDMPMFIEDALILIKDQVYRTQGTLTNTHGRRIFSRRVLAENSFEDDKVTIYCIMAVPAQVKAVIPNPEEDKSAINVVECESLITNPNFHPHGYDTVNHFRYSSRIPDFNVKMAIDLIGKAHKRNNPILKALCAEYLMENLTTENVVEVLKQAVDFEAKHLLQKCADFLSGQYKIVPIN